jgi:abhydrolase domain-containing protein 17
MVSPDVLRLLGFALFAYVMFALLAFVFAERVIFQPPRPTYSETTVPVARVPVGDDEHVAVVHLPAPDGAFTLLYSHGNAEDLGVLHPLLVQLHALGFGVLAYDYRGYGLSSGSRATVASAAEDAAAVYRHAVEELGIPPQRIIVHGRSLGSGPTLLLATQQEVAGVILEGAFTSTYRVVTRVPLLPFDRYPNLALVRELQVPTLVIHGSRDRVIPFSHGRQLYAAAPEPKRALWVQGAGHNDLVSVAWPRYAAALREFAELLEATDGGG